jgi:transposase
LPGRVAKWGKEADITLCPLCFLLRTGCQWRLLPKEYPTWQTVYYHLAKWRRDHTWEDITAALRGLLRLTLGRQATPSMVIIDSQSAKTTEAGGERGFDGGKLVKGRKRLSWPKTPSAQPRVPEVAVLSRKDPSYTCM